MTRSRRGFLAAIDRSFQNLVRHAGALLVFLMLGCQVGGAFRAAAAREPAIPAETPQEAKRRQERIAEHTRREHSGQSSRAFPRTWNPWS